MDGPVVLVGHSYGGSVITEVARGSGDTGGPVYLSAFATDVCETPPSWAVVGSGDRAAGADVVRSMAQRAGATVTELRGSHLIMVSDRSRSRTSS